MAVNTDAVIYEVSLRVQPAIAEDYLAWLREHIATMAALPGFLVATLCAIDVDSTADDDCSGWCVHYWLHDRGALENYLREYAPQMRAEAVACLGTRFRAERRVLRTLAGD